MSSFTRLAKLDCSTKRNPTNDNKVSSYATYLTGLKCTPFDPIADSVMDEVLIQTPFRALQTYIRGDALDIKKGDWLSVNGQDYPIKFVSPWTWRKEMFVRLVLEDRGIN